MIQIRRDHAVDAQAGDIDEVVATGAKVHLEMLCDNALMLIIEDGERHVHLRITHAGRSPLRVWEYESMPVMEKRCLLTDVRES